MNDKRTNESPLLFIKDSLIGENVKRSLKTLADLRGVFHNCSLAFLRIFFVLLIYSYFSRKFA